MQYNGQDINLCILSGTIISQPVLSKQGNTNVLDITLQQYPSHTLIPCIALGNFALKLHAALSQKDKIEIHATFAPRRTDTQTVFRFLISNCTILEKQLSPIPLSFQADSNSTDLLHYLDNNAKI